MKYIQVNIVYTNKCTKDSIQKEIRGMLWKKKYIKN